MSIEYVPAYKGVQFECTTSERAFGPIMPSIDVGEQFRAYLKIDPRRLSGKELAAKWEEFTALETDTGNSQRPLP